MTVAEPKFAVPKRFKRKLRRASNAKTLGHNIISAALVELQKSSAVGAMTHNGDASAVQVAQMTARICVSTGPGSKDVMLTVELPTGTFSAYV